MIFKNGPLHTLTHLTRLAKRRAETSRWLKNALNRDLRHLTPVALDVAVAERDPIGKILADLARESSSLDPAIDLIAECSLSKYRGCIYLLEADESAARRIIQYFTDKEQALNPAQQEFLAYTFIGMSNWSARLGKYEEALIAARKALYLYAQLAESKPEHFLEHFLAALDEVAECFAAVGRYEDAREANERAIDFRRRHLESTSADVDYARSSANLTRIMTALGRAKDVEKIAGLATDRSGLSAREGSSQSAHEYADSLANRGDVLSSLGLHEDALAATSMATQQYRTLVENRPDVFLHEYAMALRDLGLRLTKLERREEALDAFRQAIDCHSRLAKMRPSTFLPHLITSMVCAGRTLSDLGRRVETLVVTREAFHQCKNISELKPPLPKQDLAGILQNLALLLAELDLLEEARDLLTSAVEIFQYLIKKNPGLRPDFAMCLNQLGAILAGLRRPNEAFEMLTEALVQYGLLVKQRPDAHLSDFEACMESIVAVCEYFRDDDPGSESSPRNG